jgi:hypothetical protein
MVPTAFSAELSVDLNLCGRVFAIELTSANARAVTSAVSSRDPLQTRSNAYEATVSSVIAEASLECAILLPNNYAMRALIVYRDTESFAIVKKDLEMLNVQVLLLAEVSDIESMISFTRPDLCIIETSEDESHVSRTDALSELAKKYNFALFAAA